MRDLQMKGCEHSLRDTEEMSIREMAERLKRKDTEEIRVREMAGRLNRKDAEEMRIREMAESFFKEDLQADAGPEEDRRNREAVKKAQREKNLQKMKKLLLLHGQDILFAPGMQQEKCFIQHGKVSVFEHSVGVTLVSLMLAEKFKMKVDTRSLVRGSLLHDYFLYDWHDPHPEVGLHGFTHAKIAMENACRDFDLNEIEKDMIARHMFPLNLKPPKYAESRILCLADKIAATCETIRIPYCAEVIRELLEAV